jgi:hypothetical protein
MKYIDKKSNVYVCDDGVIGPVDNRLDSTIYLTDDVNQAKVFPGIHNFMGFANEPGKGQYLYLDKVEESGVAIFRPTMSNACVIKLKEIQIK